MTNWQYAAGSPWDDFQRAKKRIKADTSWNPGPILLFPHQAELLGLKRQLCFIDPGHLEKLVTRFLILDALKNCD
jgi:hypothetical protein